MIYVLDTDILTLLTWSDSPEAPRIRRRIAQLPADDIVATTIVNYEEQVRGWMAVIGKAKTFEAQVPVYDRLLQHLAMFRRSRVLEFDAAAAHLAEQFRRQRLRIGTMDLKIAAIVIALDAVLVTRNTVDFRKVSGLRIQDWSLESDS